MYTIPTIDCLYTATLAGINTGLITIIWRSSTFLSALADYLLFSQKLEYFHYIGLVACVVCTICIAFSKVIYPESHDEEKVVAVLPAWVPITLAIISAVAITSNSM
jgi:hypothetical protein